MDIVVPSSGLIRGCVTFRSTSFYGIDISTPNFSFDDIVETRRNLIRRAGPE